ncbi:hypothetical protein [Terasakiella pusilla]|uniref:hypothetical protein n=1 Tax=Terasakiella pusilla TaxID=64973 RepID=UPI003AA99AB7
MTWLVLTHPDRIRRGTIEVEAEEDAIDLATRMKDQMQHANTQWSIWKKSSDSYKDKASNWKVFAITLLIYMALSSDVAVGFWRGLGG